jgi:xylose isomerase
MNFNFDILIKMNTGRNKELLSKYTDSMDLSLVNKGLTQVHRKELLEIKTMLLLCRYKSFNEDVLTRIMDSNLPLEVVENVIEELIQK